MFKIVSQKKKFKQKLITNSAILNKWKFFSEMVNKKCGPSEYSIISPDCEGEKGISIVLMELLFSILQKLLCFFQKNSIAKALV